jgi:hypothetical protein
MDLKKGGIVFIIMLIVVGSSVAQGPPPPPPPPPPGLPINGFIELLLLLGGGYGTKKILKDNR